jgi:hypothetical protein
MLRHHLNIHTLNIRYENTIFYTKKTKSMDRRVLPEFFSLQVAKTPPFPSDQSKKTEEK